MQEILSDLVKNSPVYTEARFHKRSANRFVAQKGRVDVASSSVVSGVGIRIYDGAWGFAATSDLSIAGLKKALESAVKNARLLKAVRNAALPGIFKSGELATGNFSGPGFDELFNMALSDKLAYVVDHEKQLAQKSTRIISAKCRYQEIFEEKTVVTSDGACASMRIVQPEASFSAVAEENGEQQGAQNGAGVLGGWSCLFNHSSLEDVLERTAHTAVDLLKAKYPDGGTKRVILSPALVGLLCHEAIGHTVEADFVKSGSVAEGMIGKRVGSDLVSIIDSGIDGLAAHATGSIPFDDEGVKTQSTTIIKNGILNSYLHNKETATEFNVEPTGNARAWLYDDEPLIRMRNTYMAPGHQTLNQMISEVEDGYLAEGGGSGQADSNGEFMFGASYLWKIENGKKVQMLREATLSGIAFDVLKTVDAVSKEFMWDMGTGYCGKGQPAKVDAGGPYIRCQIHVGGR